MSSPTIIRHAQTEGVSALVVTYFERSKNETKFMAAFQTYNVGLSDDRTGIITNSVWSTEQEAINLFDEWRATEIGDMPGNL